MDAETFVAVDRYINSLFVPPDPALDGAIEASTAAGLPAINVAPNQGKFLHLLARLCGARRILEVGTLGGYSSIWLARAVPADGIVVTLEIDPKHAEVAEANIERAGLTHKVSIRLGPAVESLSALRAEAPEPFDMVFIDADKQSNAQYFQAALALTRPGSLIVVDNVVRAGSVIDASSDDPGVTGTRRLNDVMAAETRVVATEIQTVGLKGHDGFALALVVG
ncbi:MAG: O-methyltransferase [Acidimicrobiales bacterium]